MLRLVGDGRLAVAFIKAFTSRFVLRRDDVERLLTFLSQPRFKEEADAARIALDIGSGWAWQIKNGREDPPAEMTPDLARKLLALLEDSLSNEQMDTHSWMEVLSAVKPHFPEPARRLAATALVSESHFLGDQMQAVLAQWAKSEPSLIMDAIGEVMLNHPRRWHLRVTKLTGLILSFPMNVPESWLQRAGLEGAKMLARHLPLPFIGKDGTPTVPEITAFVLDGFADDDDVFHAFCVGAHSLQVYSGDIAAQHAQEAEVASKFKAHKLRRIREWAVHEEASSKQSAEYWKEQDAIWHTE